MGDLRLWLYVLSGMFFACLSATAQEYQHDLAPRSELSIDSINQAEALIASQSGLGYLDNFYEKDQDGVWQLKKAAPYSGELSYPQLFSPNSTNTTSNLANITLSRNIDRPFLVNPTNSTPAIPEPETFPNTDPSYIPPTVPSLPTGPELPPEPTIPQPSPDCLACQPTSPEVVGGALTELKTALLLNGPSAADLDLITKIDSTNSKLDSEEARACSVSVANYKSAKSTCGSVCTEELIRNYTEDTSSAYYSKLQSLKQARNNLDEACMEGDVSKIDNSFDKNYVFERTGVLVLKARNERQQDTVFCGAGLLSQNRVITAKHCLIDRYGDQHLQTRRAIRDGLLVFNSLKNPNQDAPVIGFDIIEAGQERALSNTYVPDDYLVLKVNNPVYLSTPTLSAKSSRLDTALILGWFKAANPDRYSRTGKQDWENKIRWSKQECVVLDVTNQCMIHTCSTENGFSGAPVWTLSPLTRVPQISGVQSAYSNATRECAFPSESKRTASFNIASSGFLGETP